MSSSRDEGPVYYREIQKNTYLKRIPTEDAGSKLRPLGHKKQPLKPMWTLFCVHNGGSPYLEQYPSPEHPSTLSHKPAWRLSLGTTRHVTASVKPLVADQYDFLVDTTEGAVRMLAYDWDCMQDWVSTLRNKLAELKILSKGENVYCPAPAPPPPRAAARDPTSPLPPTPPLPPDRVPGIEITTPLLSRPIPEVPEPEPEPVTEPEPIVNIDNPESIDISNWEPFPSLPSTSQDRIEPKSVAKICGQNICLDDSILKRNVCDSDEEYFIDIDRSESGSEASGFKQRVVVNEEGGDSKAEQSDFQSTNITVIQVSNKGPPHTAIPVLGPETDVFNFDFKQKVSVPMNNEENQFVNIVNTEAGNTENRYGTVFSEREPEYDHLSLTTTVSLTGPVDSVTVTDNRSNRTYERLCVASTSNESPLPLRRIKNIDKIRKSSLPNLEVQSESPYECLFPPQNNNQNGNSRTEINSNDVSGRTVNIRSNASNSQVNPSISPTRRVNTSNSPSRRVHSSNTSNLHANLSTTDSHANLSNSISLSGTVDPNSRGIRSNIERSHSQNAYDSAPSLRENLIRRVQNNGLKRDAKNDKPESAQTKPLWKRGLTELSLLSRLRGIGQSKRQESPTRQEIESNDRSISSSVKVVHRSRPEGRVDSNRRRSNSLSNNGQPPPLQPLRVRQALALANEQRRGAAHAHVISARDPPIFCDYNKQVWVASWGDMAWRVCGRAGDRVAGLGGLAPLSAQHARQLVKYSNTPRMDILFHRVPLAKIYVLNRRENESLGIKLDGECNIVSVEGHSPAARGAVPPPGKWALTEVNNRPINLIKGGEEEMIRLSQHGSEVSILIQPSALVKKLRAAIKASKPLLSTR